MHLWTKPALSAVAIEATRKQQRDILILSDKSVLQLWTGYGFEFVNCHVDLTSRLDRGTPGRRSVTSRNLLSQATTLEKTATSTDGTATSAEETATSSEKTATSTDETATSAKETATLSEETTTSAEEMKTGRVHGYRYVVEMRDAVEDRVNLILNDATILRVQLDFTIRSSLVLECLDAIGYALPVAILWDFKHRFFQLQFDPQYESVSTKDEWGNFTTTLISYCDPSSTLPPLMSPKLQMRSLPELPKSEVLDSDWEFFLNSDMHRSLGNHPSFRDEPLMLPVSTNNPYTEMILQAQNLATRYFRGPSTRQTLRLDYHYKFILVALHLVHEDRSINQATFKEGDMSTLLMLMSHIVRWKTWVDTYSRRDLTNNRAQLPEVYMEGPTLELEMYEYEPPDVFRWISDIVSHPEGTKPFPTFKSLSSLRDPNQTDFPRLSSSLGSQTRKVTLFFTNLMRNDGDGDREAVRTILSEGFTRTELDQLPFGISVPLRDAIWRCRKNPSPDLNSDALSFIGRNDLAELASKVDPGYYMKPNSRESREGEPIKRQDVHSLCEDDVRQGEASRSETTDVETTSSDITDLRFPKDTRVADAKKMLQSSAMVKLYVKEDPEANADQIRIFNQDALCKLALRTLALSTGRAILTFGTATPILNQKCPIPPITLSAVLAAYGATETGLAPLGGEQALLWPNFHNGVAAGLRISPNSKDVNSSWIMYNRPDVLNCEHAGFLLALGLTGHLKKLVNSHVWRYLSFKHDMTSTGLLLGLACAHRGTMNTATTRLLSVHMPALLPQNGSDLNLSPLTQVACALGIGLLYMETSHRRMAEVMLLEIGAFVGDAADSVNSLQECHSVAAGFGLGFITLGQGNKPMGLRDMRIVDTLVSYMPGSTDKNPEARTLAGTAHDEQGWGGSRVGIEITSAGATVAMGLMYLKTNSKAIAAKLNVPETQFLLDYVNPDLLMLRVICRAIVLWDSIKPTPAWILSQVPEYLKDDRTGGPPSTESGPQSYYSILAGACFAIGLRFAGSGDKAAFGCILKYLDMFVDLGKVARGGSYEESITKSTISVCLDVTTMAASMVMAGSGDLDLLRRLRKLHGRIKGDTSYGSHLAHHMALGLLFLGGGSYTLGTSNRCVAALLCSLYPRLPSDPTDNRAHLQAFRHLWVLAVEPRCLVTRDASTGVCCSVPVRVQLKTAFSQSHEFSMDYQNEAEQDNGQHQSTGPSHGNKSTPQEDRTSVLWKSKSEMRTPCLLPELSTISKIEILGPRYWPITIDLSRENEDYSVIWRILKSRSISVIRHIGYLNYVEDPEGMRGILARPFPKVLTIERPGETTDTVGSRRRKRERLEQMAEAQRGYHHPRNTGAGQPEGFDQRSASYGEDFCLTFLQDPQVASFASHLCRVQGEAVTRKDESRAAYFTSVLHECLASDKVEALSVHVWLYDIVNRLESLDELSWRTLWELRILVNYYNTQLRRHLTHGKAGKDSAGTGGEEHLVSQIMEMEECDTLIDIRRVTEVMSRITRRVEQVMEHECSLDRVARHYFDHGEILPNRMRDSEQSVDLSFNEPDRPLEGGTDWFKAWLELNEVPGPSAIQAIKRALENSWDIWREYVESPDTSEITGGYHPEDNVDNKQDEGDGQRPRKPQLRQQQKKPMSKKDAPLGRSKLLKQVFSQAFPAVSPVVLDYLVAAVSEELRN
ncbi:hypothetical protein B0O80DRAFT_124721 [Mortierella sp. GBAus27b]|nr:hypothetical protein B0O80DRAFT_124721 [Mortierella sp. GBAus27b]